MSTKIMTSAAVAALVLTGGVAFAQSGAERSAPSSGVSAQSSEHGARDQNRAESGNEQKSGAANSPKNADATGSGHQTGTPAHQAQANEQKNGAANAGKQDEPKAAGNESKSGQGASADNKHADHANGGKDASRAASGESHNANDKAASRDEHGGRQNADAGRGDIGADKQARISETIRNQHVENITKVDFDVRVGGIVPTRHHFHQLPDEIVSIVPEYRGYDYVVANDEVVIIEPHTHKIVYTMQEGRSAAMDHRAVDCR